MALTDRTNLNDMNMTRATPTKLSFAAKSPIFDVAEDDDSIGLVEQRSEPEQASETLVENSSLQEAKAMLSEAWTKSLQSKSSSTQAIFASGQVAFAFIIFGDISILHLCAWGALAYLLCGGVASAMGKTRAPTPPINEEHLQPYVQRLVVVLNQARSVHRNVFLCADPFQALKGAGLLYSIGCLSSWLAAIHVLWFMYTLAFVLHQYGPCLEPLLPAAKAKAWEQAAIWNAQLEATVPKKYLIPVGTLLWTCYSSYSTIAITVGVGCIALQAWQASNPMVEAELQGLSTSADAALDKIKQRARRMSISAKDMIYGKTN